MKKFQNEITVKKIALSALIAAMLLAGQVVIRFIPNVEVVTLIIMVSAFAFPPGVSILAALVFCTGQWLIYGFGYWVPAYYIYWIALAGVSIILKLIKKNTIRLMFAIAIAVICTTLFGVLTSATEAFMIMGISKSFFNYFNIVYLRGIWFYVTHIISNAIIVGLFFIPLSRAAKRFAFRSKECGETKK